MARNGCRSTAEGAAHAVDEPVMRKGTFVLYALVLIKPAGNYVESLCFPATVERRSPMAERATHGPMRCATDSRYASRSIIWRAKIDEAAAYFDGLRIGGWCHVPVCKIAKAEVAFSELNLVRQLSSFGAPSPDVARFALRLRGNSRAARRPSKSVRASFRAPL
jgi:hypothetical protein